MKRISIQWLFVLTVFILVLAACGPKPQSTQPPVTEPPVIVEPTSTLAPIDLGGPVMEVGATYPYVDGSILVAVPGSEFTMGYGNEDNLEHKVTLGSFWIYRDEVTNSQYALCAALGQCSPLDTEKNGNYNQSLRRNDPVTGVNWDQAQAYCTFVNGRLPSEAEWEKTARGPNGNIYPWGNEAPSCDLANAGKCNPETTAAASYLKGVSYYGASDMVGNVFEWVADWYDPQYYSISPVENPLGPEAGTLRSVRSSAHHTAFYLIEAARRFNEDPTKPRDDLGFRCVVEDPSLFAPWCQIALILNPDQSGGGPESIILPIPECPSISVTANGFCNKNFVPPQPAANLNFGDDPLPADALITYPLGCVPDGTTADPSDYNCSGASGEGPATIQANCTVPPPPVPPGCAPGYTQDGNTCEYTGGLPGNTCLPGISFVSANQCCASIPGGTDSYTLCPVDAPYNVGGVCMPWPLETKVLKSVSVGLGLCDGSDGNGCQLSATICRQLDPNGAFCFDARACACVYPLKTGACP
jgi:sulfatase modifying factor 1